MLKKIMNDIGHNLLSKEYFFSWPLDETPEEGLKAKSDEVYFNLRRT